MPVAERQHPATVLTDPGDHPVQALADLFGPLATGNRVCPEGPSGHLLTDLRRPGTGLDDGLAVLPPRQAAVTEELTEQERGYVAAARARSTLTGYAADWREFTTWCADAGHQAVLPASPAAISQYLTYLAEHGAKVGTMSRRLSAIRYAHQLQELPDPTKHARVVAVWEGIRRVHGAPPVQSGR